MTNGHGTQPPRIMKYPAAMSVSKSGVLPYPSPSHPAREQGSRAFIAAGACTGSRRARPIFTPEHRGGSKCRSYAPFAFFHVKRATQAMPQRLLLTGLR